MRCISRMKRFCTGISLILILSFCCSCGSRTYTFPYNAEYGASSFQVINTNEASVVTPFAANLCIVEQDILGNGTIDITKIGSAILCDVNDAEVLYAKNAHEKLYPASLTKIMTALIAIKYGSMDQILTAGDCVNIDERGAQLCGLKTGDSMTLSQALHILLLYSANDVAMMIAECVGGSVDHFIELMNEEAKKMGATNTNFVNPHGLTADNHYTTAYDLYLILNEAMEYEIFKEIIHMTSYNTIYYDKDGKEKEFSCNTTNLFLRGDVKMPENVTVVGGKTGTTNAAGHCLALLSRDTAGAPYISVILRSDTRDDLYDEMSNLLSEIGK